MRRREALPDPEVVHGLRELEAALAAEPTADPELALLVADVDRARPEPSATFLASLDARVHAGFPREDQTPRRATTPPWHARLRRPQVLVPSLGGTLAAALVVLLIASGGGTNNGSSSSSGTPLTLKSGGSSDESASSSSDSASSSSSSGSSSSSTAAAAPAPKPAMETSTPSAAAKAAPSSGPLPSVPKLSTSRKVERSAELSLAPAPQDVQETADGVVRETQAAGGYVQESTVQTRDNGGSASLMLRIPSARMDATLGRLSKLAHVSALNQAATDITAQTASAAELLSDARSERQALLRALGKATTARQIASLKARIADNRSEIAQRKGALNSVRRRADLSTVQVDITGTRSAAKKDDGGGAWTPRDALHDAGRVLEVAGGVALIALAVLAPLAVLALLALLGARVVRRRRREGALDGAT